MNVLDLFSGAAGGWSLGLHRAGFRTVAACEIDNWRRGVYGRNFPGVRLYSDVRELTATRLVADLGYLPDVIVGSPPCQDASAANHKGKGIYGEQTGLFMEAIRLVGEIRPAWACFENSPRLRTRGIDRVIGELETLGYACWPLVVGADDVGAPHIRKRMWLVAADTDRAGLRDESRGGDGPSGQGEAEFANDPHANGKGEFAFAEHGEMGGALGFSGDTDCARLAQREGIGDDAFSQLAAIERTIGTQGLEWNGGPLGSLRMAHGVPTRLARQCIAAYGDAVVPDIAELIGRAIMSVDRAP